MRLVMKAVVKVALLDSRNNGYVNHAAFPSISATMSGSICSMMR